MWPLRHPNQSPTGPIHVAILVSCPFATMCEQDSMSRSWSELPMSALTLTFEKLPLSQRAGSVDCVARVCSSWAEAAAAATRGIKLLRANTDSLQRWLYSRGTRVLGIHLVRSSGVITTLPCSRLQDLRLRNCSVDLRPGSQLLSDLCSATALTTLYFCDITYQGEPDLAAVLLALPNLQELWLFNPERQHFMKVQHSPQQQQQQQCHASTPSNLQHSREPNHQLLPVQGDPLDGNRCFSDSGMQFICKLTQLQRIELGSLQGVTAAGLAGLHNLRGLNCLGLGDVTCDISLSAVPAFSQLTHLTAFALCRVVNTPNRVFDPAILLYMMQLQRLYMVFCTPAGGAAGAAELLYRLSQMPELRVLHLCIQGLEQCSAKAFSSLTSSSLLESLTWVTWSRRHRDLPGPWQHMFPDTLQLSAMTKLNTITAMLWEGPDLDRLVSSCCNLQILSLCCSPGLQLTALLQLTAVTQLWLTRVTAHSTVASLVQLSALQSLQEVLLFYPCSLTDDDAVRSLTALTQLTCLGLSDSAGVYSISMQQQLLQQFGRGTSDQHVEGCHVITNKAPAGAPPNVWSQLLSCCEACAQATQQHMAAQDVAVEQQEVAPAALPQLEQQQQEVAAPAAPQQQQHAVEAPGQQQHHSTFGKEFLSPHAEAN